MGALGHRNLTGKEDELNTCLIRISFENTYLIFLLLGIYEGDSHIYFISAYRIKPCAIE